MKGKSSEGFHNWSRGEGKGGKGGAAKKKKGIGEGETRSHADVAEGIWNAVLSKT